MRTIAIPLVAAVLVAFAGCNGDARIERRVNDRLAQDPGGPGITATVDDRVVPLRGIVRSDAERTRLDNAVSHVDGVLSVQNQLVIQEPVSTTGAMTPREEADRALAASIDAQLKAAGYRELDVAVHDQTVRVTGPVPITKHDDAMRIVRETAGAYAVDDETIAQ